MSDLMTEQRQAVAVLEERLERGWVRIQEAQAEGKDVEGWTDHFVALLHEYEKISDELLKAA